LGDNKYKFVISRLKSEVNYNVRVTDFNLLPSQCSKVFDKDQNDKSLFMVAPASLYVKPPDIENDFTGGSIYSGSIFATCKGDQNISFTGKISGGNSIYNIWLFKKDSTDDFLDVFHEAHSTTKTEITVNGLGAGNYLFQVSDLQNCESVSTEFEVKEASDPLAVEQLHLYKYPHGANTSCYGSKDGRIEITGKGGIGKYTFSIDSDFSDSIAVTKLGFIHTFDNLAAISAEDQIVYALSLKDELGCKWNPTDNNGGAVVLSSPENLKLTNHIVSPITGIYSIPCKDDSAVVQVYSSGGKFPHLLTVGDMLVTIDSLEVLTLQLYAGEYALSLKDNLGCAIFLQSISLSQPETNLSVTVVDVQSPNCIGGAQGKVQVTATGGVPSIYQDSLYSFVIAKYLTDYPESDTLRGDTVSFYRGANGFASMAYFVSAVDENLCKASTKVVIQPDPSPLTLKLDSVTAPSCYNGNDGTITVTASNYNTFGDGMLRFRLTGGPSAVIKDTVVQSNTFTFNGIQGTDLMNNVPYSVWVDDYYECIDTAYQYINPIQIQSVEPINISLVNVSRPSCFDQQDGFLVFDIAGGVPPYQYSLDNKTFEGPVDKGNILISNLSANNYKLYVKDANYKMNQPTCLINSPVVIPPGRRIHVNANVKTISCKGLSDGAIDLTTLVENYPVNETLKSSLHYNWTYENFSSSSISEAEDLSDVPAGLYKLQIKYVFDSLSCETHRTFTINEPSAVFSVTDIKPYETSCGNFTDGNAFVTVAGTWPHSPNYYQLDSGGWRVFNSESFLIKGITKGDHSLSIGSGKFSCLASRAFSIGTKKLPLFIESLTLPTCSGNDGVVVLQSISNDVLFRMDDYALSETSAFIGLSPGSYNFTAQKSADPLCYSDPLEIQISEQTNCEDGTLTLTHSFVSAATCTKSSDGICEVTASGGTAPYNFYWDKNISPQTHRREDLTPGTHEVLVRDANSDTVVLKIVIDTLEQLELNPIISNSSCVASCDGTATMIVSGGSADYVIEWTDHVAGSARSELCPGVYLVSVADNRNQICKLSSQIIIGINSTPVLTTVSAKAPTCYENDDGAVIIDVNGGSGQYSFHWNNGDTTNMVTGNAGTYSVKVVDELYGCSFESQLTIPAAPAAEMLVQSYAPSCSGKTDGSAELVVSGVSAPLIEWENGNVGSKATNLGSGAIRYKITDDNGCIINGEVNIPEREPLLTDEYVVSPTCSGFSNGQVRIVPHGGSPPYFLKWSNGSSQTLLKNISAGEFAFTVTDKNNCSLQKSIVVPSPEEIEVKASITTPTCYGLSNGAIELTISGGTADYSYNWENGSSEKDISKIPSGIYRVTVTDFQNCLRTQEIFVPGPEKLAVKNSLVSFPSCNESSDGYILPTVSGGVHPLLFTWSDGSQSLNRSGLKSGKYILQATDAKGCEVTSTYYLEAPSKLEVVNVNAIDPKCNSEQNGMITFDVLGGTPPYKYLWDDGHDEMERKELNAGRYDVSISDSRKCFINQSYLLKDPMKEVILGIPPSTTICDGGTAFFSPQGKWEALAWERPDGTLAKGSILTAQMKGAYTLTVWNEQGCAYDTTFTLDVSKNLLVADFLRISKPVVNKPIVFIDITTPQAQNVVWIVPDNQFVSINKSDNDLLELIFVQPGNYTIGLKAFLDNCFSEVHRVIAVEEQEVEEGASGRIQTLFDGIALEAYPNPARNEINVSVTVPAPGNASIKLIRTVDGYIAKKHEWENSAQFSLTWDLSHVPAGVYSLLCQQNGRTKSLRVVVVN
jgi:hypothetical protein